MCSTFLLYYMPLVYFSLCVFVCHCQRITSSTNTPVMHKLITCSGYVPQCFSHSLCYVVHKDTNLVYKVSFFVFELINTCLSPVLWDPCQPVC